MPIPTHQTLREKGWSEEEITHAVKAMNHAKTTERHPMFSKRAKIAIFWIGIIVALLINFFAAAFLIPLLLVIKTTFLFITVALMGFAVGGMFWIILKDLEAAHEKTHYHAGIIIPGVALASVWTMVWLSNNFNIIVKLRIGDLGSLIQFHSPWLVAIVYVIAFTLPYLVHKYLEWIRKKKHSEIFKERIEQHKASLHPNL